MSIARTTLAAILILALAASQPALAQSQKPLDEAEVAQLVDQFKDKAVIARLEKQGIAFTADEAALVRLKKAGASDETLAFMRKLGGKPAEHAVTFQQVAQLLTDGAKDKKIMELLAKSPTTFTLGADQVAELKKLGASDELIKSMSQPRAGGIPIQKLTDLVIILDCSGSMDEKTPDGVSKMAAARTALQGILPKIPDGLRTAFIIYGHDKALKCEAVKVVRPLTALDSAGKAELANFIAGLKPVGSTPIALSLRVAGAELARRSDALGGIILITDGVETCKGDPAAEAARLARDLNLTFGVNVVGFGLNPQESKAVAEIADKGKGKYCSAKDAGELGQALEELVQKVPVQEPEKPQASTAPEEEDTDGVPSVRFVDPGDQFPKLKLIALVKARGYGPTGGASYYPFWEAKQYGATKRKPADADKFDIYWHGEGMALPVLMVKDFSFKNGKIIKLNPSNTLGFVKVVAKDLDKPKLFAVTKVDAYGPDGGASFYPLQTSAQLGEAMVVPVGVWDIWFRPEGAGRSEKMRAKFKVEGGKTIEIK